MEKNYGIGVTNRYDLFCMDDDASDPSDSVLTKKAKQQKKAAVAAAAAAAAAASPVVAATTLKSTSDKLKNNEKENKLSSGLISNASATHDKSGKGGKLGSTDGSKTTTQRPIKDTQNLRKDFNTKDNNNKGTFERNSANNKVQSSQQSSQSQQQLNGESREQRFNRRNNQQSQQTNLGNSNSIYNNNSNNNNNSGNNNNSEYNNSNRRIGGGGGGGGGGDRGERRFDHRDGPRRPYDGRGNKREFDRQSGSDKTGVKSIDKREGGGAHNWGSVKQDIEDVSKSTAADWDPELSGKEDQQNNTSTESAQKNEDGEPTNESNSAAAAAEEETKEITLDEWKAQRAGRAKPQFNIRKAGEGEDTSQWKKMIALQNRKKKDEDNSDDELEYDPSMYPQRVGRQKHVLDIEFHFNDGRRGGGMNRGGRGGRPRGNIGGNIGGGGGIGRGGPPNRRGDRGGPGGNAGGPDQNDATTVIERPEGGGGGGGERRSDRPPREPRGTDGGERRGERRAPYVRDDRHRGGLHIGQNAPKVDDEHDFPSLG